MDDQVYASRTSAIDAGRGMRILIIEDLNEMADYISKLLDPIRREFPGSTITIVHDFEAAKVVIQSSPPPDVFLLDLTLPPMNAEETLSRLHEIEGRSPYVILTGHTEEYVRRALGEKKATVLYKDQIVQNPGLLFRAMHRVIEIFFQEDRVQERYAITFARLERLKKLEYAPKE